MVDIIDKQIAIINKNIHLGEKPRKDIKSLKKLLRIQKDLLKEYSVFFEGMNYDSYKCVQMSLDKPVEYTDYAIDVLESDDDNTLAFYDDQIDKALALIFNTMGFDAFLDPRVLEVLDKLAENIHDLRKTHSLLQNVRFIPNNASSISLDFNRKDILVKLPHDLEALDENFMSEIIASTVPFLNWVKTVNENAHVKVSGYNGTYSAKIIFENDDNEAMWRTKINPVNRRFKEIYPEDSTFENFTDVITHLVELNEKLKIASR